MKTEQIKVDDIIETTFGNFKVIDILDVVDPYTMQEKRLIMVDYNGSKRVVRNEDIIAIID